MRNILLTISYDGTDFCGWQRQDGLQTVRTVQGALEDALEKIHGSKTILYGSGRTDSGVHACAQAANFFSPVESIPLERYPLILNNLLPHDVRVMSAQEVAADFNARFSATSRVYRYFMCADDVPSASSMRYVWHIKRMPHMQKLNALASCLRGELDCAAFAASGDASVSTNRYIESARFFTQQTQGLFPVGNLVVFEIEANAFLWKMVRSITGTIMQLEKQGAADDALQRILETHDRKRAGVTAPPHGLFLWHVKFDGIRRHV
ncbi:MAG: tRNA pseudouridine(38-40) synthase TruA [Treponema sp.]|nr:tRNA pseudouridine(38-40) synthase TruA [Treponema sp.]